MTDNRENILHLIPKEDQYAPVLLFRKVLNKFTLPITYVNVFLTLVFHFFSIVFCLVHTSIKNISQEMKKLGVNIIAEHFPIYFLFSLLFSQYFKNKTPHPNIRSRLYIVGSSKHLQHTSGELERYKGHGPYLSLCNPAQSQASKIKSLVMGTGFCKKQEWLDSMVHQLLSQSLGQSNKGNLNRTLSLEN